MKRAICEARSSKTMSMLDCDILLSPHPFFFGMQDKLEKRDEGNPFVNNVACMIYAESALDWLEQRLRGCPLPGRSGHYALVYRLIVDQNRYVRQPSIIQHNKVGLFSRVCGSAMCQIPGGG